MKRESRIGFLRQQRIEKNDEQFYLRYEQVNCNPHKKRTTDCVERAIAYATNKPYEEIVDMLVEVWKKKGYHPADKKCYEKVLEDLGFEKHKQPRYKNGTKVRVGDIADITDTTYQTLLIVIPKHLTCVIDATVYDIWDCRDKFISNYYTK